MNTLREIFYCVVGIAYIAGLIYLTYFYGGHP